MRHFLAILFISNFIIVNKTLSMDNNFNQNDLNQKYPKITNEHITPPSSPKSTIPICPGAPCKKTTRTDQNAIKPIAAKKLIF